VYVSLQHDYLPIIFCRKENFRNINDKDSVEAKLLQKTFKDLYITSIYGKAISNTNMGEWDTEKEAWFIIDEEGSENYGDKNKTYNLKNTNSIK
jgi:hypothetical protein